MAVVANTLIGRSRKSVGNATFSRWKNLNILKEKGKPNNPQTDLQMQYRARFSILVHLSSLLQAVIRIGFKQYNNSMTEFNKFVSENSKNGFLVWDAPNSEWDSVADQLVIAKGSLQQTVYTFLGVANNDTDFTINFSPTAIGNQSVNDILHVLVLQFGGTGSNGAGMQGGVVRSDGTATIDFFEPAVTGQQMTIYTFFMRADGTIVSNSLPLSFTVA